MKSEQAEQDLVPSSLEDYEPSIRTKVALDSSIADSLDLLVEYLVDNHVKNIHPFIMGEVEKRLIIKVLERSRGNKVRAAECLGISRNTFLRKFKKLSGCVNLSDEQIES
jgi:DNA-binding protein Fis